MPTKRRGVGVKNRENLIGVQLMVPTTIAVPFLLMETIDADAMRNCVCKGAYAI